MKPIYNYTQDTGEFCGAGYADESPLDPGVFLIPAFSTEVLPPAVSAGQRAFFLAGAWEIRVDSVPVPEAPTVEELIERRRREVLNLHNRMAKERWAGMLNFERDSEELVELASAFGMSATQVDDLFCFAETIK